MPKDLYPELERRLRETGCRFVRSGKGSHEIWFSPPTADFRSPRPRWTPAGPRRTLIER